MKQMRVAVCKNNRFPEVFKTNGRRTEEVRLNVDFILLLPDILPLSYTMNPD